MNDYARSRMRGMRDGARGRRGMRDRIRGEYRGGMDFRGDYAMRDGRQGVKGTGRYGRGGSMYRDRGYEDDYDYDETYEEPYDYDYDYAMRDGRRGVRGSRRDRGYDDYDYADEEDMHLSKREMQEWKRSMENADGTKGEHFSGEEVMAMAEKMGVKYKGYDEKELCLVTNMLYSDYCEALRGIVPPDKELMVYIKLAKAWLEDEDAPEGSEKLALYYRCIVDDM